MLEKLDPRWASGLHTHRQVYWHPHINMHLPPTHTHTTHTHRCIYSPTGGSKCHTCYSLNRFPFFSNNRTTELSVTCSFLKLGFIWLGPVTFRSHNIKSVSNWLINSFSLANWFLILASFLVLFSLFPPQFLANCTPKNDESLSSNQQDLWGMSGLPLLGSWSYSRENSFVKWLWVSMMLAVGEGAPWENGG